MLPSDDCDECVPDHAHLNHSSARLSYAIFLFTFLFSALIALRRILPRNTINTRTSTAKHELRLPLHNYESPSPPSKSPWLSAKGGISAKRLMYLIFAVNVGLSAVLIELLLCEISNAFDPKARSHALKTILPALILFLTLICPAVQIMSILTASGLTFATSGKRRIRWAWVFEAAALISWLCGFWFLGQVVLEKYFRAGALPQRQQSLIEGCLERIGVVGITLMASLSGFAAVSAVWHTFLAQRHVVTDSDISRRQAGLDATEEMLEAKRSRLRAIERKLADVSSRGVFTTVVSTLRGTGDSKERSLLNMEINGLETMRMSMQDTVYLLKSQKDEQDSRYTLSGQLILVFTYAFAVYCVIRLGSVSFSVIRRILSTSGVLAQSNGSDPVTMILSIVTKNGNPTLDRAAWARQISFLFSGFMLFAAFNSALQTFLILGRAFPGIAISATAFREETTMAMLISQLIATYVISAALMLRSSVPKDVSSVISEALGAPLEPARVDAWFEGCFVFAAAFTAAGIWAGNQIRNSTNDDGDIEMGKMN